MVPWSQHSCEISWFFTLPFCPAEKQPASQSAKRNHWRDFWDSSRGRDWRCSKKREGPDNVTSTVGGHHRLRLRTVRGDHRRSGAVILNFTALPARLVSQTPDTRSLLGSRRCLVSLTPLARLTPTALRDASHRRKRHLRGLSVAHSSLSNSRQCASPFWVTFYHRGGFKAHFSPRPLVAGDVHANKLTWRKNLRFLWVFLPAHTDYFFLFARLQLISLVILIKSSRLQTKPAS